MGNKAGQGPPPSPPLPCYVSGPFQSIDPGWKSNHSDI